MLVNFVCKPHYINIMDTSIINCEDLYFEHKQWMSELHFWEQELKFFQKQLEPLVRNITDKKILVRVTHFQNQFDIHKSTLNEFKDAIENHNQDLVQHTYAGVNALDRVRYRKHVEIREQMIRERELYQDLKKEYYAFLVHVIALDFDD